MDWKPLQMGERPMPNAIQHLADDTLCARLGGERNGDWINIPGPGHSKADRSLGIRRDARAPNGIRIHSLSGDDEATCREYVLARLTGIASDALHAETTTTDGRAQEDARRAFALRLWDEASPAEASLVETYLKTRKCWSDGLAYLNALRFHPACPFSGRKTPAMLALMTHAKSGRPTGIHRTALKADGSGKLELDSGPSKRMLGRAIDAIVRLKPAGRDIAIAEGIETALSASRCFERPVWAALSAGGIQRFPIIDVRSLLIFADNDDAGMAAAVQCGGRYKKAGIRVAARYPLNKGEDWNDFILRSQERWP